MKVFVSWSGTTSRLIAEALSDWMPKVIQGVEPFVSAKDIDKGANWTVELSRELENAQFGVICLAPDNLLSPWLNYETGAITRSVDSRVCPVLFGVRKDEIKPPMSQLQLTVLEKDEMLLMMSSINKVAGGSLRHDSLREAVDVWWPQLEKELAKISIPNGPVKSELSPPEPAKPVVDVSEMMEELLHRVRSLDERMRKISSRNDGVGTSQQLNESRPMQRPSAARDHIKDVLERAGIAIRRVRVGVSTIEVELIETIADPIPADILSVGELVSIQERITVRFASPGRFIEFDPSGALSETPF
ncbi:hypothetical protein IWX81_000025 [Salinibacterium sp. CAN_S4]|uniref:toll/interleukin-1 receptor domain-containing protein n=1 Tax=Salinibacterium sp. CAN_S4 TaxID=2787727 RepID=UPI0018EF956C